MTEEENKNQNRGDENAANDSSDDFVLEEEEEFDSFGNTKSAKQEKLRKALKECQEERKEYLDGWQRAKADLVNTKKEFAKKTENIRKQANEHLIEDIIPVLDSFQMAFSNKESWEEVSKEWRTGVEHIHNQLLNTLKENGVAVIEPKTGDDFEPRFHEAQDTVETSDEDEDDTIQAVTQRGYSLNDKIVRPAKVTVAKYND